MTDLDQLAAEVNARLTRKNKPDDHRLAAGLLLRQAKELVPHGQWGSWCEANIERSRGDVIRLMALAAEHEPEPPSIKLPVEITLTATDDAELAYVSIVRQEAAFRNMAKALNELAAMMAVAKRCAVAGKPGWGADKASLDIAVQTADRARQIARNMLVNFINNTDFLADPAAIMNEDRRNRARARVSSSQPRRLTNEPRRIERHPGQIGAAQGDLR